jgi:hypothetical protein
MITGIGRDVREQLRMGWLQPVAKVVCPDVAAIAIAEEWGPQEFVRRAIPRIATWIKVTQGIRDLHLANASGQNFILKMMNRRLDLFYDEEKGTWPQYVFGIAKRVVKETRREDGASVESEREYDRVDQRPADAEGSRKLQVKLRLLKRLANKRPAEQRQALAKYNVKAPPPAKEVPRQLTYMRRYNALEEMREELIDLGFRPAMRAPGRYRTPHRRGRTRYSRTFRPDSTSRRLRRRNRNGKLESERTMELNMAAKQAEIDAKNARALQALFNSLPESLKDRLDVLAEVREIFEREFAKRLKSSPRRILIGGSGEPSAP